MESVNSIQSARLKTNQKEYAIKIDRNAFDTQVIDRHNFHVYQERLTRLFENILTTTRRGASKTAKGWLSIDFDGLKDKKGKWKRHINTDYGEIHDLTAVKLLQQVEKTLNSNETVSIRNGLKLFINYTDLPSGGSRRSRDDLGPFNTRRVYDEDEYRRRKDTIIDVAKNTDDLMCLARCLVVGQFISDRGELYTKATGYKSLVDSRRAMQRDRALELHNLAGIPTDRPCGLADLDSFQRVMPDHQILVYSSLGQEPEIIYPCEPQVNAKTKKIYLWLHENHYSLINPFRMRGFLAKDNYCHECHKAWQNGRNHKCETAICKLCGLLNCQNRENESRIARCESCNRDWPTPDCRTAHKLEICLRQIQCKTCLAVVRREKAAPNDHNCMVNQCQICGKFVQPGHTQCFIQKPKRRVLEEQNEEDEDNEEKEDDRVVTVQDTTIIYADIESELDPVTHHHRPILVCLKHQDNGRTWSYRGEDCLDRLLKDLLEKKEFKGTTIAFHNLSGYDGILVLRAGYDRSLNLNPIFRSSKVLSMFMGKSSVRFLDTLLHVSMALARLPAAYNFEDVVQKGRFPILLATRENREYNGDFPDMAYFDPDHMGKKQFVQFERWYDAERQKYIDDPTLRYDIQQEMLTYCEADVEVLRMGFERFRQTYREVFDNIDPAAFITLPSYINYCYRALAMPIDSIAVLPPKGFDPLRCQSNIAVAWLEWEAKSRGLAIKHARNSIEVKIGNCTYVRIRKSGFFVIGPYYADGFVDPTDDRPGQVFEFDGCVRE